MPTPEDLRRIAALATDAADKMTQSAAPAAGSGPAPEASTLGPLLAEMQALLQAVPVRRPRMVLAPDAARAPRDAQTDAEVEAGFDNMPI